MSQLTPDDVLLGLLAVQACHGYELLAHFRDASQLGQVWNLSTSQLYAVLKRLETGGLIAGHSVPVPDAPPRTEFRLTVAGQAQFERWLTTDHPSASVRRIRVEFLSRLYIARLLQRPTIPLVERQRQTCQARLAELTKQRDAMGGGVGYLAVELMIFQLTAIMQWLDRCELRPIELESDEG